MVDGTYLSCRAYFGYAGRGMGLSTRTGVPTSITYSVIKVGGWRLAVGGWHTGVSCMMLGPACEMAGVERRLG